MKSNLALLRQAHPVPMTRSLIRLFIPQGVMGVYVLFRYFNGVPRPVYSGRSETDLRRQLLQHLVTWADSFVAVPCDNPQEAYLAELYASYLLRPSHSQDAVIPQRFSFSN